MNSQKLVKSGLKWSLIDLFFAKGFNFIGIIIFAYLLGPEKFGIIGIISIVVNLGNQITDSGLSSSVIVEKKIDQSDLSTIFFLNLSLGLVFYLTIFFLSPIISQFFNDEIFTSLLRVHGLGLIIASFTFIHIAILTKNLQFRELTIVNLPCNIISLSVGLTITFLGYGVWGFVWMYLTNQLLLIILLPTVSNWKPSLEFSKKKASKYFRFGSKLMFSTMLYDSAYHLQSVVIGRYFSIKTLGLYEGAKRLNTITIFLINGIVGRFTFPVISKTNTKNDSLEKTYKIISSLIVVTLPPLIFSMIAISDPLILIIYGAEWASSVSIFKLLTVTSLFIPFILLSKNIIKVEERSGLLLRLEAVVFVFLILSLLIGYSYGVHGIIWCSIISFFLSFLLHTFYAGRIANCDLKSLFLENSHSLLATFLTYHLVGFILKLLSESSLYIQVILPTSIGFLFYLAFIYIFNKKSILILKSLLR